MGRNGLGGTVWVFGGVGVECWGLGARKGLGFADTYTLE